MSTLSQQTVANAPVSDLQSHEKILVDLGRRLRTPGNDNRETAKAALDEADSLLKHCYFLEGSLERKEVCQQLAIRTSEQHKENERMKREIERQKQTIKSDKASLCELEFRSTKLSIDNTALKGENTKQAAEIALLKAKFTRVKAALESNSYEETFQVAQGKKLDSKTKDNPSKRIKRLYADFADLVSRSEPEEIQEEI